LWRRAAAWLAAAAVTAAGLLAAPSFAAESPWQAVPGARARLIATGFPASSDPERPAAALEIRLDPGWKTYWRDPGEGGLPPVFDWSGSDNLKDAQLRWPLPKRFVDAGAESIGYQGEAILPLVVEPIDPDYPVRLALTLSYAICKDLCVPVEARLALAIPAGSTRSPHLAGVEAALARVPPALPPDGSGVSATLRRNGPDTELAVGLALGQGERLADVFLELPSPWQLGRPVLPAAPAASPAMVTAPVLDRPEGDAPALLRVTVVTDRRAFETRLALDASSLPR
jgi:DsbC/DsbD-like thiol-disulfide interchange protein